MAGKQQSDLAAPPKSTAVLLLDFGKLLYNDDRRRQAERNPDRIAEVEAQLIEQISNEKGSALKSALNITISNRCDPIMLRILAVISYMQLCTDNFATPGWVVKIAGGDEPASIIAARKMLSHMLITKRLRIKHDSNGQIELGRELLQYLGGGSSEPPLMITEYELVQRWKKAEAQAAKKAAKPEVTIAALPTAKQLAAKISESVVGLEAEVRTFACRVALHQRRAALIRADQDPGSPNEALLFIGPSGCGKTYLAECAGRVCGLPFGAISSTDLTAEGYIGLGIDDAIKQVIVAANNNLEHARYGICFFDEFDKKRTSGWETGGRDICGASVQQGVLKLIEGCEFQVGGRKGMSDWGATMINTKGMFFCFAGAFVGLEKLLEKRTKLDIGFGGQLGAGGNPDLYDALIDFGLIPEFVNRLTGVSVFPAPTVEQLTQIAVRSVIPAYQKLLATGGTDIQITGEGIALMAECAKETRTFARGIKTICARLIEDCVYEERKGLVELGAAEVAKAIEAAGMGAAVCQAA